MDTSKVFAPGCWDLLHYGHARFLSRAAAFGDLYVGVPTDEVVLEDKGSAPTMNLAERLEMLSYLPFVKQCVVYSKFEFLSPLEFVRPEILAVGSEWGSAIRHRDAERWCKDNLCDVEKIGYTTSVSTSEIKQKIYRELHCD